jgi:hypothetical protein
MDYGSSYYVTSGPWADFGAGLGWVLLIGPPIAWVIGQFWFSGAGRRMGLFTPLATAVVGCLILNHLQRWPF